MELKTFSLSIFGGCPCHVSPVYPSSSSRNCHPRRRSMSQPNEQALRPIFLSFYQCLLACLESRPPVIAIFRLWLLSKAGGPCLQGPTPILISFFIPPSSPFAHGKDRGERKKKRRRWYQKLAIDPQSRRSRQSPQARRRPRFP